MTAVADARLVGRWALGERIGGGGQAAVHRAVHADTGTAAAVKVFHRWVWADRDFRVRFRRECEALAALDHPNIVPILDAGEDDGRGYLAMGLAEGGSLAERLAAGPMRPALAMEIISGIAAGLDAAHAAGLVHRDVTPGNILLDRDGPWLADFGIARRFDATMLTGEGQLIGTAGYLAPEVISGGRAGPASDRYALAAVAYEALIGRRVFVADGVAEMLYAHVHRPPPRPSRVAGLPRALDDAMDRALAKDPRRRPGSAAGLIVSLERALGLDLAGITRRMTRLQAPTRRRPRRVLVPVVTALVGLAGLGGGAVALSGVLSSPALPPVVVAPAPVAPAPLTVPAGAAEVSGAPVHPGDLPGGRVPPDAVVADVGASVRVVAIRGGWASLRGAHAALRADGFTTSPLVVGGRTVGLEARRPDLSDLTGQSPRWALVVLSEQGESRALVVEGRQEAPAGYVAALVRARGASVTPLS